MNGEGIVGQGLGFGDKKVQKRKLPVVDPEEFRKRVYRKVERKRDLSDLKKAQTTVKHLDQIRVFFLLLIISLNMIY